MTSTRGLPGANPARHDHRFVIVLAGGSGARLASLTQDARGEVVPKQYCSFRGDRSLLGDTMARAAALAPAANILVVVANEHERYWQHDLAGVDRSRIVVQPQNRGTAAGVLLPLLAVLERDPEAVVTLLPSDHFVGDEATLAQALQAGQRIAAGERSRTILVGIEPDAAEPDYGWIVANRVRAPVAPADVPTIFQVVDFVEKPGRPRAAVLWAGGAVWNSFLVISRGANLIALIEQCLPSLVEHFASAAPHASPTRAQWLYERLPSNDFSRDVLAGSAAHLGLLVAPACGWTDLGTPHRLLRCLKTWRRDPTRAAANGTHLDLATTVGGWAAPVWPSCLPSRSVPAAGVAQLTSAHATRRGLQLYCEVDDTLRLTMQFEPRLQSLGCRAEPTRPGRAARLVNRGWPTTRSKTRESTNPLKTSSVSSGDE